MARPGKGIGGQDDLAVLYGGLGGGRGAPGVLPGGKGGRVQYRRGLGDGEGAHLHTGAAVGVAVVGIGDGHPDLVAAHILGGCHRAAVLPVGDGVGAAFVIRGNGRILFAAVGLHRIARHGEDHRLGLNGQGGRIVFQGVIGHIVTGEGSGQLIGAGVGAGAGDLRRHIVAAHDAGKRHLDLRFVAVHLIQAQPDGGERLSGHRELRLGGNRIIIVCGGKGGGDGVASRVGGDGAAVVGRAPGGGAGVAAGHMAGAVGVRGKDGAACRFPVDPARHGDRGGTGTLGNGVLQGGAVGGQLVVGIVKAGGCGGVGAHIHFVPALHGDGTAVLAHQAGGLGGDADRLAGVDQVFIAVPDKAHGLGGDVGGVGQFSGGEHIVLAPGAVQGDGDMDRLVLARAGAFKGKYAGGGGLVARHRAGEGDGSFGLLAAVVLLAFHGEDGGVQGDLAYHHRDHLLHGLIVVRVRRGENRSMALLACVTNESVPILPGPAPGQIHGRECVSVGSGEAGGHGVVRRGPADGDLDGVACADGLLAVRVPDGDVGGVCAAVGHVGELQSTAGLAFQRLAVLVPRIGIGYAHLVAGLGGEGDHGTAPAVGAACVSGVSAERHSGGAQRPVGGVGLVSGASLGNGDGRLGLCAVGLRPACKDVALLCGVIEDKITRLHRVAAGVDLLPGKAAAVQVIGDVVGDRGPFGVEGEVAADRVAAKIPRGGAVRVPVPPAEVVAVGGGGISLCNVAALLHGLLLRRGTVAVGVEGDRIGGERLLNGKIDADRFVFYRKTGGGGACLIIVFIGNFWLFPNPVAAVCHRGWRDGAAVSIGIMRAGGYAEDGCGAVAAVTPANTGLCNGVRLAVSGVRIEMRMQYDLLAAPFSGEHNDCAILLGGEIVCGLCAAHVSSPAAGDDVVGGAHTVGLPRGQGLIQGDHIAIQI